MINEKIKSYDLYSYGAVETEEQLKKAVALSVMEVCTSDYEFYNKISNKILYIDDFVEACIPCLKSDITEKSNVYIFLNCAKDFYNLPNLKSVLYKIYKELGEYIEEDETRLLYTVSDVFEITEQIDNMLVLPEKWLSPDLYKKIGEFLKTFDFERTKYKKRVAYKNMGEFTLDEVVKIGKNLNGVSLSEKFDFYPTPQEVVNIVQEMAEIKKDDKILEPSAGTGSLLKNLDCKKIQCIELNPILTRILKSKGYNVINEDFEKVKTSDKYDKIIMNPPFGSRMDAKHIVKAFELLENDGCLVAVHSSGILTATDKHSKSFQTLFNQYGIERRKIEAGAFKNSGKGTNITTYISKFIKE